MTDLEKLQEIAKDSKKFSFVGDMNRPGVKLFFVKLEYTHYNPNYSKRNHLFEMSLVKWPDDFQMIWGVISIPIEDKKLVNPLLEACGLKLVNGVPTMVGGPDKIQVFPMQGERVWSLENVPDHPIYKNDMALMKELLDKESKEIDSILDIRNN